MRRIGLVVVLLAARANAEDARAKLDAQRKALEARRDAKRPEATPPTATAKPPTAAPVSATASCRLPRHLELTWSPPTLSWSNTVYRYSVIVDGSKLRGESARGNVIYEEATITLDAATCGTQGWNGERAPTVSVRSTSGQWHYDFPQGGRLAGTIPPGAELWNTFIFLKSGAVQLYSEGVTGSPTQKWSVPLAQRTPVTVLPENVKRSDDESELPPLPPGSSSPRLPGSQPPAAASAQPPTPSVTIAAGATRAPEPQTPVPAGTKSTPKQPGPPRREDSSCDWGKHGQCLGKCQQESSSCRNRCLHHPPFEQQIPCLRTCPNELLCKRGCPCSGPEGRGTREAR